MKKLLYLGIVLMLASCGSSIVNVDGREVSTIKIGDLEVMVEDLGLRMMDWDEAKKACENLGGGWRLPTKEELNILYENKDKIGADASYNYWSSTEDDNGSAWTQLFFNGFQVTQKMKYYFNAIRVVRSI